MTLRAPARMAAFAALLAIVLIAVPGVSDARSKSKWQKNTATSWLVGGGGDPYRTGFNPTEKRPKFISCRDAACRKTGDSDGPWLEWVTRMSDLPSGVWSQSGMTVHDGKVFVAGGSTNSFMALDADTGLPAWRFQPDPRTDGYTSAYPASNGPAIDTERDLIYVTFSNGWLYALDLDTGRKVWSLQAKDGYTDTSDRTTPDNAAEEDASPYREESFVENRGIFQPVHPGVKYPKIHGATAFCEDRVAFMTLSGWVYSVNADNGKLDWKRYIDGAEFPGELVWPEFKEGGVQRPGSKAAGMSTRRFEAVPGLGCLHGELQVAGSDGHIRFVDPQTGRDSAQGGDVGPEYNRTDEFPGDPEPVTEDYCQTAGFNCDIAVGLADPTSGDYFMTTLDARVMRLHWDSHAREWKRTYRAPLPFENPATGEFALPAIPHNEVGFITGGVTGGPLALNPTKRLLYFANQDGHLYILGVPSETTNQSSQLESCPPGMTNIRPETDVDPATASPCLVSRTGITPNTEVETRHTRRGEGGPWDFNQHALSGLVLGGDVIYVATWDNKINAFDVRDPAGPELVWQHEVKWDKAFQWPPFGDTFDTPFADIDLKVFSSPALVGGALYLTANDGAVYKFNLREKKKTVRNLVILGSGAVPFLPEFEGRLGAFDRVWTPADWYKNQVPPAGYRFPKPAGVATASTLLLGSAAAWWYVRRREDLLEQIEEAATR